MSIIGVRGRTTDTSEPTVRSDRPTRSRRRRSLLGRLSAVAVGVALTSVAGVAFAGSAFADYPTTPSGPAWTPDGPVHATLLDGSTLYVGGSFTGGVAALHASDGSLIWQGDANGDVRALATSGSNLLIGGAFTTVDGASHKKLASLSTGTGAVNSAWKAAAGGTVRDEVVSGNTLYFGGAFTKQNGQTQGGLGAVTVDTGKLIPSFTTSTDDDVFGLAIAGSRLVFSGNFTSVNGQVRNSLASVTMTGDTLDPWAPARVCSGCNQYWDVVVDNNTAFIGSSGPGGHIGAYDLTTGSQKWKAVQGNGDVQALAVNGSGELYAGGHFAVIAGQTRKLVADFSESTGALGGFSANFVTAYPGVWALTAASSSLYVGGHFTAAGPTPPKKFPYLAFFG